MPKHPASTLEAELEQAYGSSQTIGTELSRPPWLSDHKDPSLSAGPADADEELADRSKGSPSYVRRSSLLGILPY